MSARPPAAVHENAWVEEKSALYAKPATCPALFTASAALYRAGSTFTTAAPPAGHDAACCTPAASLAYPTTCPLSFTAAAELKPPPSEPRSVTAASPGFHSKAW